MIRPSSAVVSTDRGKEGLGEQLDAFLLTGKGGIPNDRRVPSSTPSICTQQIRNNRRRRGGGKKWVFMAGHELIAWWVNTTQQKRMPVPDTPASTEKCMLMMQTHLNRSVSRLRASRVQYSDSDGT